MVFGEFATNLSDVVFILLHLLGLILAVIFSVRLSHQIVPKSIVGAFVFWALLELVYILGYIKLFTLPFTSLLGEVLLFIAFILVFVGSSE
ncbi:MAG: hypothetical protein AABX86_02855 [Nanoarchaeota archaeon]